MTNDIFELIQKKIDENDVILFMKGDAALPKCGFSATVCQILSNMDLQFRAIDVLENADLRQGIKDFTDWPTIPQLYIKGEFIGGCDIIKEMYLSGELLQLLKDKQLVN